MDPNGASTPPLGADELGELAPWLAQADAAALLTWADRRFGRGAALASSFSAEDLVLIDLAARHAPRLRLFTLDTGRLPPETYEVMEQVRRRYGATVEAFFPEREAVEELELSAGFFSFRESLEARHRCCAVRKLEPLGRALRGRSAWVTGLRRDQATTRAGILPLELDARHGGLAKLSPLWSWSEEETWDYVRRERLPVNPLYARGYRSIGCAPCTRAIGAGDDVRAGRWWWESPEHKECGLHARPAPAAEAQADAASGSAR